LKSKQLLIAVVDDEAQVRKGLERLMRGAGFGVETYATGIAFLQSLGDQIPDCVVLDLHMPGLTGFDIQDWLLSSGSKVPVIVITGHDSAEASEHAMAAGAFAYLRKPVDGPELVDVISRAVSTAQAT
jgi:FixJ family two-component response regulator